MTLKTVPKSLGPLREPHAGNAGGVFLIPLLIAFVSLLCLSASKCDGQVTPVQVKTLGGEQVEGVLVAADLDSITIQVDESPTRFQLDQIDSVSTGNKANEDSANPISVTLIDGSRFYGKSFTIKSKELTLNSSGGQENVIETRIVDSVRFKTYETDLKLNQQWREIINDESREGDALVVNRSGELNSIEGIVGETKPDKLGFSIGDRTAMVGLEKIDAILFYHAGRELASTVCAIQLTDGSRVLAKRIGWRDSKIEVTCVAGGVFSFGLEEITVLDFSMGRSEFLSNREPTTNDWQALMTSSAIMEKLRRLRVARVKKSFGGEPLSLKFFADETASSVAEVKQFEHGFAMQGGGKLAFSLNAQYQNLAGWVGFDPKASQSGQVKLSILADGKPLIERVLNHRTMRQPLKLDLNIKDVKRIVFQVDYQDGRSTGDQIHLVDLKVSQ